MDERARQVGVNEALFRAVNEQIESLNRQLRGPGGMQVVCECGNAQCVERVTITVDTYERVRKDPRRFIVVPGHDVPEYETVLEEHREFNIIEKIHPEPERIAEETDPRA
jgi:hypothetical protein